MPRFESLMMIADRGRGHVCSAHSFVILVIMLPRLPVSCAGTARVRRPAGLRQMEATGTG